MRHRRGMLKHRQLRAAAHSNGHDGRLSAGRNRLADGDDLSMSHAPATIHEQISLVTLQQTAGKKCGKRMVSGTRPAQNEVGSRSLLATSRSSKSLRSSDDSHPHKLNSQRQRASLSDDTLSAAGRPTSRSHPIRVQLPTLPTQHAQGASKRATKPCRHNSARATQDTSTRNQSARSKLTGKDLKQGSPKQKAAAKKPRVVPILAAITPDNVEQEKQRFFESDFEYNPQFTYRNPPSSKALARFSRASDKLIKPAVQVFRATLQRFKSYKRFEAATGGRPISTSQFTAMFQQYLAQEGLSNKVVLNLSDSLVARALMTRTNGRPTLNARPNALRAEWSNGLLRHEIGTHYIRSSNHREHPWSSAKGRRLHRLAPANPTEEGIASIHSVLLRKEPFLWRSAMLYYTTYMAGRLSFADLFRDLGAYIQDPEVRWEYCLRAKRGQSDTSQPGCFNKDQVYLEGAFRVLRYRHVIDFHSLYRLGKVALEDVDRLKTLADLDSPALKIPTFMADADEYRKRLDLVVSKNGLEDDQLAVLFPGETPAVMSAALATPVGQEEYAEAEGDHCSMSDELVE